MATQQDHGLGKPIADSLLIDSILSRSEMDEVNRMLEQEDDQHPFTSTQMGRTGFTNAPMSLSMSPIEKTDDDEYGNGTQRDNKLKVIEGQEDLFNCLNKVGSIYSSSNWRGNSSLLIQKDNGKTDTLGHGIWEGMLRDLDGRQGSGGRMSATRAGYGTVNSHSGPARTLQRSTSGLVSSDPEVTGSDVGMQGSGNCKQSHTEDGERDTASGETPTVAGALEGINCEVKDTQPESKQRKGETSDGPRAGTEKERQNGIKPDDHTPDGEIKPSDSEESSEEEDNKDDAPTVAVIAKQFKLMNALLTKLDGKSDSIHNTVEELKVSLEYSQHEIDKLKEENKQLRGKLNELDTEEQRTAYHLKSVEEQVDRVDTNGKKKNLILEGIPEKEGGREEVSKAVWDVLDQLKLDREVELDSCYRTGSFNKTGPDP